MLQGCAHGRCLCVDGAEAMCMFVLSGKSKGADYSPAVHNGVSAVKRLPLHNVHHYVFRNLRSSQRWDFLLYFGTLK